ncbi:hypothetical protein MKW92_047092 [Papaver armeniacum]|nr:hypothetical protein MKW92_047092 [Papaver armeniacum]
MASTGSGEWLEKALLDICKNIENGLDLDSDLISGLVSFCELAPPEDAQQYLNNIVGEEAGQSVIEEYMQRRGYIGTSTRTVNAPNAKVHAYVKPPSDEVSSSGSKKQPKATKEVQGPNSQENKAPVETSENRNSQKVNPTGSKKKKSGKVISLAEAAKGSVVFQQGKPCTCQARRHKLVSNCLSCGKIVCEQEGEGPCSFCGALVLREGSTYAGLDESFIPLSDAEATAEAFAKRLVDYDRNSAARTTVIDDQSDYYEIEGNSWLSKEEKGLLMKKRQDIEEADKARRNKVVMTFDLVGRKVLMSKGENEETEPENSILRRPDEREVHRIKPNPNLKVQPVFVDPGPSKDTGRAKQQNRRPANGICLEISGRVQHDGKEQRHVMAEGSSESVSVGDDWQGPSVNGGLHVKEEDYECSWE